MKLRTLDNSIRLRLSQTEVDSLRSTGRVSAETWITPNAGWRYELRAADCRNVQADLADHVLTVSIPTAMVKQWADTEQVSLRGEQASQGEGVLKILVEKDFTCLAPRDDEDEADLFPHPDTGSATC